jgi:NAD+ kinase
MSSGGEQPIDLIITVGGDGTILNAAYFFQKVVPPIVPFHFGTVGFLNLFNICNFANTLSGIISTGSLVNLRMRLRCTLIKGPDRQECITHQVLNEVVIDRGASPYLTNIDMYSDGGHPITTVQADGLIVSTPTGSTAYSMSAGASVVHPEIAAMIVTPICPHALSFRPFLLPDSTELTLRLNVKSRGTAWVRLSTIYAHTPATF